MYYIRWVIGKLFKVLAVLTCIGGLNYMSINSSLERINLPHRYDDSSIATLFVGAVFFLLIGVVIDVNKKDKNNSE